MRDLLYVGQWQGFFKYGPEYGEFIEGQEAEFRLFIEDYNKGQFSGKVIDWEGLGAEGEVATVKGFIDGDFISFTKQYSNYREIDEFGNVTAIDNMPGHSVVYEGVFDAAKNCFYGDWEISTDLSHAPDLTIQEYTTGTWRMQVIS